MSDEHRTALLLTEPEWQALAAVCAYYIASTQWAESDPDEPVCSRRAICDRVREATA